MLGLGPALVDYINLIDAYPPSGGHCVVKETVKMSGGAGANVICGLSNFGIECGFYSTLGEDEDAVFYAKEMKNFGVKFVYTITHPETGRCVIYVDKSGERTFFVHPNASGILSEEFKEKVIRGLKNADYIYLDPFPSETSFEFELEIAVNAKNSGCEVILNPGYPYASKGFEKLEEMLVYCDMLFMSKFELDCLKVDEMKIGEVVDLVVVTKGGEGSIAIRDGERFYAEATTTKVVDTTGAGDAFTAGFLYAYMKGLEIDKCLKAGNFSASVNIRKLGARAYPEKEEMDDFLSNL